MGLFSSVGSFVNDVFGATSSSDKAFGQTKYLANQSYGQQKEFAQNAHQWEMEDLQKAGLNPALTTGASSAGAIAGGGGTGGQGVTGTPVDALATIGNVINGTRQTNADIKLKNAQTSSIPQKMDNETTSAKADLINAEANRTNAETQKKIAEEGAGGKFFGIENGGLLASIATALLPTAGLGIAGLGIKGYKAYKAAKTAKGFGNFLKAVSSAK